MKSRVSSPLCGARTIANTAPTMPPMTKPDKKPNPESLLSPLSISKPPLGGRLRPVAAARAEECFRSLRDPDDHAYEVRDRRRDGGLRRVGRLGNRRRGLFAGVGGAVDFGDDGVNVFRHAAQMIERLGQRRIGAVQLA